MVVVLLTGACAVAVGQQGVETGPTDAADSGRAESGELSQAQPSPDATAGEDATEGSKGAMVLVMDASGSMNATDANGVRLLDGAKEALHGVVATLPDNVQAGLRVYGHTVGNSDELKARGCRDTELIHPVGPVDRAAMDRAIDGFSAKGWTPIGYALQQAAADLPAEGPRAIILVSDGEDTCAPPQPCDVARQIAADGTDLVVHSVGFALGANQQARRQLECIAEAGGGTFLDVGTVAELAEALPDVSEQESRRYQVAGQALEGTPIPRDANTGRLGTAHTDRVRGGETNFYRFEIPPGAKVRGEAIITGDPAEDSDVLVCPGSALTDEGDSTYPDATSEPGGGKPSETYIKYTDPVVIDDDEVWLRIETSGCAGGTGPTSAEFDVELKVAVVE